MHSRLAALHNPPQNDVVPDAPFDRTGPLAQELLELTARTTARAEEDPFGNPVLLVALAISRRIDAGALDDAAIGKLIEYLRDAAFADRARRIAAYVGGTDVAAHTAVLKELAQRLLRPDPNDSPVRWAEYRALVERSRFAVVFTAHPTFALPHAVAHALAETASGRVTAVAGSHRPPPITLADEFAQAAAAIANGRDAIDQFNAALLSVAHGAWPDRWTELDPRPVILSSWVGYDTDGRTDIGWWDTLRLRLEMKRRQLARLHAQVTSAAFDRAARRTYRRGAGCGRRTARSVSGLARTLARRRLRADAGGAARGGADLAAAAAAAVRRRRLPRQPTTMRDRHCASRGPDWCRMDWRSHTRMCGSMPRRSTMRCASVSASPMHRRTLPIAACCSVR